MTAILLSAEQIRSAPPDVRRWIEREISTSLGLASPALEPAAHDDHADRLVACSTQELAGVLAGIQGVIPVVNVFFEFARQGTTIGSQALEAYRLVDIMHHARLQDAGQVVACLDMINQTLRQVRNETNALFCAFDQQGHCFVPVQTQQNILRLWNEVIANQRIELREQQDMPAATPGAPPTGKPNGGAPGPVAAAATLDQPPTANF